MRIQLLQNSTVVLFFADTTLSAQHSAYGFYIWQRTT